MLGAKELMALLKAKSSWFSNNFLRICESTKQKYIYKCQLQGRFLAVLAFAFFELNKEEENHGV